MGSGDRRTGIVGRLAVAAGLLLGAAALAGGSSAVSAQEQPVRPTATAVADCVGETGRILVTVIDNASYRYDIIAGDKSVLNTPDGDGLFTFEPYVDGAYPVSVTWISRSVDGAQVPLTPPDVILSTTVTVDCIADVTTTATPTTATPTTAAPTTAAPTTAAPTTAAPAAAAPPSLPATGRASQTIALLAGLLTLAGGALLVARRQPGRA